MHNKLRLRTICRIRKLKVLITWLVTVCQNSFLRLLVMKSRVCQKTQKLFHQPTLSYLEGIGGKIRTVPFLPGLV